MMVASSPGAEDVEPMGKLDWRTVDRYFAGEATAAERERVDQWLAKSPAFRMLVSEIYRSSLDDATVECAEADVQARLLTELDRTRASTNVVYTPSEGVMMPTWRPSDKAVAAVVRALVYRQPDDQAREQVRLVLFNAHLSDRRSVGASQRRDLPKHWEPSDRALREVVDGLHKVGLVAYHFDLLEAHERAALRIALAETYAMDFQDMSEHGRGARD